MPPPAPPPTYLRHVKSPESDEEGINRPLVKKKEEDTDSDFAKKEELESAPEGGGQSRGEHRRDDYQSVRRARETWQRQQRARKEEVHPDRLPPPPAEAVAGDEADVDSDDDNWGNWHGHRSEPHESSSWQGGPWSDHWHNPYPGESSAGDVGASTGDEHRSDAASSSGRRRTFYHDRVITTDTHRYSKNGIQRLRPQPGAKRRGRPQVPRWEREQQE